MTLAIQVLLGLISSTQAVQMVNDWPSNDLTCKFSLERLNKGTSDFANHPKGVLYNDASFPAAVSSLFWEKYPASTVRRTY